MLRVTAAKKIATGGFKLAASTVSISSVAMHYYLSYLYLCCFLLVLFQYYFRVLWLCPPENFLLCMRPSQVHHGFVNEIFIIIVLATSDNPRKYCR